MKALSSCMDCISHQIYQFKTLALIASRNVSCGRAIRCATLAVLWRTMLAVTPFGVAIGPLKVAVAPVLLEKCPHPDVRML